MKKIRNGNTLMIKGEQGESLALESIPSWTQYLEIEGRIEVSTSIPLPSTTLSRGAVLISYSSVGDGISPTKVDDGAFLAAKDCPIIDIWGGKAMIHSASIRAEVGKGGKLAAASVNELMVFGESSVTVDKAGDIGVWGGANIYCKKICGVLSTF